jgi:hypothetical protein
MRLVSLLFVTILLCGCNRPPSVGTSNMWLNGYNRVIILPSSGDSLGIHKAIASAFAEHGFDVVVSTGERAETDHKTGLHTVVVSYGDSQRVGGGVDVYCRDYTRGLMLTDHARDPRSYWMQINVSDPAGKAKEYTTEWIDDYRTTFDANAVLLRPAWWTNVERNTGSEAARP